ATLPLVQVGAVLMTIDPPFLACWCWALVCVLKGLDGSRLSWWLAAGLLVALGTLAKYTMALFPVAVVGFRLFHRRTEFRRAGIWILLAGAVTGWAPVMVWNAQHDWVSFRHVFTQVGEGGGNSLRWLGPLVFAAAQAGVLCGFWFVVFLTAAW